MNTITEVGRTVNATVAHELGEPVSNADLAHIQPSRFRTVAGLRMATNAARDAIVDEESARRFRGLQQYRTDETMLKARLSAVDITPLATLPLVTWEKLLDMTGLYRFLPNSNGQVAISTKVVDEAIKEANGLKSKWPSVLYGLLIMPASAVFSALTSEVTEYRSLGDNIMIGFFSGLLLAIIGGMIYTAVTSDPERAWRNNIAIDLIRQRVTAAVETSTINSLLWPDLVSPQKSKTLITIGLPDPTPEASEAMLAVERTGLKMYLAAVGEAIHLLEDPVKVLLKEGTRQIEEMERRLADPIVYVIEGNAVAVIAQYGDFPIEQEVVNEVVNSVHLI